jgi:lipoprotein-releasing system ATP-binding protein
VRAKQHYYILGTLDKPSTDKGIELKINGDDILSMKDKTLSKFRNLNLGFIFSFTNYYLSLRL